jgi:hypothetical protein
VRIKAKILYKYVLPKLSTGKIRKNLRKNMSIPIEIAWLVPLIVPFIVGLLVGAIIKKGLKLLILIVALVIVLVAFGVLSVTFSGLYATAMTVLPKLYDVGHGWLNALPYASITFLIGLAIGLIFV